MRRYLEERRWRKRLSGVPVTLRREARDQTGLDTPVVLALNDAH